MDDETTNKPIFRRHDDIDVCEIRLPGGNVGVFPVTEVIAGSQPPQTFAERYHDLFEAYKAGRARPAAADAPATAKKAKRKPAAKPAAKAKPKAKAKAPAKKAAKKHAAKAKKK